MIHVRTRGLARWQILSMCLVVLFVSAACGSGDEPASASGVESPSESISQEPAAPEETEFGGGLSGSELPAYIEPEVLRSLMPTASTLTGAFERRVDTIDVNYGVPGFFSDWGADYCREQFGRSFQRADGTYFDDDMRIAYAGYVNSAAQQAISIEVGNFGSIEDAEDFMPSEVGACGGETGEANSRAEQVSLAGFDGWRIAWQGPCSAGDYYLLRYSNTVLSAAFQEAPIDDDDDPNGCRDRGEFEVDSERAAAILQPVLRSYAEVHAEVAGQPRPEEGGF